MTLIVDDDLDRVKVYRIVMSRLKAILFKSRAF